MKFHFSKREHAVFYFLVVMIAGYVFYRAGYQAFWSKWQTVNRQVMLAEKELVQKTGQIRRYSAQGSPPEKVLAPYSQKGSDSSISTDMIAFLQERSAKDGVRIIDTKPGAIHVEDFYKAFSVSMTLEGSFVDMMRFFYDIELAVEGFKIQEFRFFPVRSSSAALRCQVVVSRVFIR